MNRQFLFDAVVLAQHGGVRYAYFCSWVTIIQVIQLTWSSEQSIVTLQYCTRQITTADALFVLFPVIRCLLWIDVFYATPRTHDAAYVLANEFQRERPPVFAAERETAALLLSRPQATTVRVCNVKILRRKSLPLQLCRGAINSTTADHCCWWPVQREIPQSAAVMPEIACSGVCC